MKTNYAMENVSCNNVVTSKILKDAQIIVKGQNGHLSSADIVPVHSACSKQNKVLTMESENKLINRPLTPISDNESSCSSLALNIKEKLNINAKSVKSIGKNGIKLGTTDVEVHCGPSVGVPYDEVTKVLHGITPVTDLNLTLSNSQSQFNSISSHERKYSAHLPSKANLSGTTFSTSVLCSNICKTELNLSSNGTICNGHTISEATSSNSIAVSDFSLSSDKSTSLDSSYSYSGARPRKRNTSNSSSKSVQQSSECEVGLSFDVSLNNITSESCKTDLGLPEEKLSILEPKYTLTNHFKKDSNLLNITYVNYENENQMDAIMKLIQKDLSEPYSIYTYRYFIHNWPKLCFLAVQGNEVVGAIVCKLDVHKKVTVRGYIAMLAVDQSYRKRRIGSNLVQRAIREMTADDADEVVLETEITNKPALQLYENLGFVRDKRLFRYYLNGVDALRLKLWLR